MKKWQVKDTLFGDILWEFDLLGEVLRRIAQMETGENIEIIAPAYINRNEMAHYIANKDLFCGITTFCEVIDNPGTGEDVAILLSREDQQSCLIYKTHIEGLNKSRINVSHSRLTCFVPECFKLTVKTSFEEKTIIITSPDPITEEMIQDAVAEYKIKYGRGKSIGNPFRC